MPFIILPEVISPTMLRTGAFFAKNLNSEWIPEGSTVLDMGTGSGVCALFAAKWAETVFAVDINPNAVHCATLNVALHRLEDKIRVLEGDLFGPVSGEKFDVVLFNPPFFEGTPRDDLDRGWRSTDVAERFATELGDHLNVGGYALLILSSDGDESIFLDRFGPNGFEVNLALRRDFINEVFSIYRVSRTSDT